MKPTFLLMLLFAATVNASSAQQTNGCNFTWGQWTTALNGTSGNVFYAVQYSKCTSSGICGWPKIILKHSFASDASLDVKLRGYDCDGKPVSASFSTGGNKISSFTEYNSNGNWHYFKSVTEVARVEVSYFEGNDWYRILLDKDRGINEIYINGKTRAQLKTENDNRIAAEQRLKEENARKEKLAKEEEAEKKKKEEADARLADEKKASKKSGGDAGNTSTNETSTNPGTKYTESETDRQMRIRSERQQASDKSENEAMAAAMAGTAGAMVYAASLNENNDDEDESLAVYLKGTLGFGLQQIPINSNMIYNGSYPVTQNSSTNHYSINAGLLFAAFNNQFISLRLSPFFSYGLNAFDEGTSGSHISYGAGAAIGIGRRFKFLIKGEYAARSGDITEDAVSIGIDAIGYSSYKYYTLKYGAGLYLGFAGHDNFGEISAYRETLSFLSGTGINVFSYEAKASFSLMALAVQYSPNYPLAGEIKYPATYEKGRENYFTLSLYVPLKLFSIY